MNDPHHAGKLVSATPAAAVESREQQADSTGVPFPMLGIARSLWTRRRFLLFLAATSFVVSLIVVLLIPPQYESSVQLMPPEGQSSAMFAAALTRANSPFSGYAGDLLGMKSSGALFVGILRSRTVRDRIVERLQLKKVYGAGLAQDAREILAALTAIGEDRKSGLITVTVTDRDPKRAAALARAYVEELDHAVAESSTSAARRERQFIEERLQVVKADLDTAAKDFSQFASKNATVDLKEQARAMVESAAVLEGQRITAQADLRMLEQVYARRNVRVRAARARVEELERQLRQLGGSSSDSPAASDSSPVPLYPPLRKLPLLGVTYSDLYRRTKIQETVFELLTQQYELAKVQEAREIPSVRVLDPPQVPERRTGPSRASIVFLGTLLPLFAGALAVLVTARWAEAPSGAPEKVFLQEIIAAFDPPVRRALGSFSLMRSQFKGIAARLRSGANSSGNSSAAVPAGLKFHASNPNGGTTVSETPSPAVQPKKEKPEMGWSKRNVLVTGGASFIGSTLVDALIERGASIRVVDNLSSGKRENLAHHLSHGRIQFLQADLLDPGVARGAAEEMDVVFHLAADHGGRGYVDLHQTACASNLILDGLVFRACADARVKKVIFASSGCVYPNFLQNDPGEILYLTEDKVGPPYDSDNLYGWAKLMGELSLAAHVREGKLKGASCRFFTVYGERGHENHAIIAMIARAFVRQNPFVVWGNGEQVRNWTYVGDIVEGAIRTAEKIDDGRAVNLGTMERVRVLDAVHEVLHRTGHCAEIELHPEMPTGPVNRVADNSLARRLLGWEPRVKFVDGLQRTIDWYFAAKDRDRVAAVLDRLLIERTAAAPSHSTEKFAVVG